MTFIEWVASLITYRTLAEVALAAFMWQWGYGSASIKHRKENARRTGA